MHTNTIGIPFGFTCFGDQMYGAEVQLTARSRRYTIRVMPSCTDAEPPFLVDDNWGCDSYHASLEEALGVAVERRQQTILAQAVTLEGGKIPRFTLKHGGKSFGYVAEAARTGDDGIYDEVRIGVFKSDAPNVCVADVLVGLTEDGEIRFLATTDGEGDGDARVAIYPQRRHDQAVDRNFS